MEVPDRIRILKLDEPPLVGRVRFQSEADRSVISNIRCGILFVMAFWSVTSFQSFTRLKRALSQLDADHLEVVIVDTDGCPDLYEVPELAGKLHGNGEAAWVSAGRICTVASGSAPQAFETFTRHLLEECPAKPDTEADYAE